MVLGFLTIIHNEIEDCIILGKFNNYEQAIEKYNLKDAYEYTYTKIIGREFSVLKDKNGNVVYRPKDPKEKLLYEYEELYRLIDINDITNENSIPLIVWY